MSRRARQTGITLIAVLAVIALVTALAVGALSAARSRNLHTARTMESVQQSEDADSAIRLAIYEITSSPATNGSASISTSVFGQTILVDITYESDRIDLNHAPTGLLAAAFAADGLSIDEARAMAARIVDWRDIDDDVTPGGAERDAYRSAGDTGSPRNAPFETVNELRNVLGASQLSDEFLDRFTVYSHSSSVQTGTVDADMTKVIAWAKANSPDWPQWIGETAHAPTRSAAGDVLRLQACAPSTVVHVCRRAIVRLTGNPRSPVMVYVWDARYSITSGIAEPTPPR